MTEDVMTRDQYLVAAKQRALALVEAGDIRSGWLSMVSDLKAREETAEHVAIVVGQRLLMNGALDSAEAMSQFIEGFN